MTPTAVQLSVVIPTLNAAATLATTLAALSAGRPNEIVISDGGSTDGTLARASGQNVHTITGAPGRGGQLARGAAAASGAWLLFLHADTQLASGWPQAVASHIHAYPDKAAYFQFALDDASPAARRLERIVAWRCRAFALPYGDQGLLISRALYDALRGYRDMPLMEDVDFVRRIGRKRLVPLACRAVTSARKFQRSGYLLRSARNLVCLGLYFAGADPRFIKRIYG